MADNERSPRKLDVLKALWGLGCGSGRAIHHRICLVGEFAFNTIQTLLRIMEDKGMVRRAICSHRIPGRDESTPGPCQSSQRFLSIRRDNILMALIVFAAVIGLDRFAAHVSRQNEELAPDDYPGAGVIVHSEVVRLWLPQTLIECAKLESLSRFVRTHEELRRFLELRRQQNLWYALTIRGYQVNDEFSDVTYIKRPYDDNQCFQELLVILATAAGNPPGEPTSDLSKASIHVISDEFLTRDPRKVMAELQDDSAPSLDKYHFPRL
jgi:hypothetical protein